MNDLNPLRSRRSACGRHDHPRRLSAEGGKEFHCTKIAGTMKQRAEKET